MTITCALMGILLMIFLICSYFSGSKCIKAGIIFRRSHNLPAPFEIGLGYYAFFFSDRCASIKKGIVDYLGFGSLVGAGIALVSLAISLYMGG